MTYDFIELDRKGKAPLYQQLYDKISSAVENGSLTLGAKLPSIRKLSEDLQLSRTTIEAAYQQLCVEGYIKSLPQKGYFVQAVPQKSPLINETAAPTSSCESTENILYDLGSDLADRNETDIKLWRSHIKDVLKKENVIASYGDPQGEPKLRNALALYSHGIRGAVTDESRILIGAGTQALLYIICGLISETKPRTAAMEEGGFPLAERVFSDCGFSVHKLKSDSDGIIPEELYKNGSGILFINPSCSQNGQPIRMSRRRELLKWAEATDSIIIEDDYNGELRYSSRPFPALQSADSERVIYIGSFSKMLLPSVRIGYAVLTPELLKIYKSRTGFYNQTSSKIEQLALAEYIKTGELERRLRRLRKLYREKSSLILQTLESTFTDSSLNLKASLQETALCFIISLTESRSPAEMLSLAKAQGVRLSVLKSDNKNTAELKLGFGGIPTADIIPAINALKRAWS